MNIKSAIDSLNSLSSHTKSTFTPSASFSEWDKANKIALNAAAEAAKSFIVSNMQRQWPPSSKGGEPPAKRTGTLSDSISVIPYSDTTKMSSVTVNVNSSDRSKGKRLPLYSKYLQTGWTIPHNGLQRNLPKGENGNNPKSLRRTGIAEPGKVQPRRPFLDLPIRMGYTPHLALIYRRSLFANLPHRFKSKALKAKLTIQYIRPSL